MAEEQKTRVIYSFQKSPLDKRLDGLFLNSPAPLNNEGEILKRVITGSKYEARNVIAIGFKFTDSRCDLPFDELFLTTRGYLEYEDTRHKKNYLELIGLSEKFTRLTRHLSEPIITSLLEESGPRPYFKQYGEDRVLAIYFLNQKE